MSDKSVAATACQAASPAGVLGLDDTATSQIITPEFGFVNFNAPARCRNFLIGFNNYAPARCREVLTK